MLDARPVSRNAAAAAASFVFGPKAGVAMLTFVCATLGVGCSGISAPGIEVSGVALRERTAQGTVLEFTLLADNPNGEALPLQDVTYSVSQNNVVLFSGTRSAEAVLRRFGQQEFTLPAAIPTSLLAAEAQGAFTISGSVIYIAPGALSETLFDQQLIRPSADFSGTATLK